MDLTVLRQSLGLPDSTPNDEVLRLASERLAQPQAPAPAENPAPTPEPTAEVTETPAATPPAPTATVTTPPTTSTAPATPVQDAVTEVEITPPAPEMRIPEGAVLVDAAQWEDMQRRVQTGELAAGRLIREDRERYINSVIAAGRMSPQNTTLRQVIEAAWNRNPAEADAIVENLAQAFPVAEIGHAAGGIEASAAHQATWDAQDAALFPELAHGAGKVS